MPRSHTATGCNIGKKKRDYFVTTISREVRDYRDAFWRIACSASAVRPARSGRGVSPQNARGGNAASTLWRARDAPERRLAGTASPHLASQLGLQALDEVLRSGCQGGAQPSRQAASQGGRLMPDGALRSMRAACICGVATHSKSAISISAEVRKPEVVFSNSPQDYNAPVVHTATNCNIEENARLHWIPPARSQHNTLATG